MNLSEVGGVAFARPIAVKADDPEVSDDPEKHTGSTTALLP